jgi:hypothetical protein
MRIRLLTLSTFLLCPLFAPAGARVRELPGHRETGSEVVLSQGWMTQSSAGDLLGKRFSRDIACLRNRSLECEAKRFLIIAPSRWQFQFRSANFLCPAAVV